MNKFTLMLILVVMVVGGLLLLGAQLTGGFGEPAVIRAQAKADLIEARAADTRARTLVFTQWWEQAADGLVFATQLVAMILVAILAGCGLSVVVLRLRKANVPLQQDEFGRVFVLYRGQWILLNGSEPSQGLLTERTWARAQVDTARVIAGSNCSTQLIGAVRDTAMAFVSRPQRVIGNVAAQHGHGALISVTPPASQAQ